MAAVGLSVFVVYASGAYLGYVVLSWLWLGNIDLPTLLAALLIAAVVLGYLSYRVGTARILASVRSVQLPEAQAPAIHRRLETLVDRMDVAYPEVRIGRFGEPNALSVGGARSGVIVLDAQLVSLLDLDELEGILAHELAHLESHDVLVRTVAMTAAQTIIGVLSLVFFPFVLLVMGLERALAWLRGQPLGVGAQSLELVKRAMAVGTVGLLVVLTFWIRAFSRRREFEADVRAAEVTGNPAALAAALDKIQRATDGPWGLLAHLSMTGEQTDDRLRELLATHPPIEERIEHLQAEAERIEAARWTQVPVE